VSEVTIKAIKPWVKVMLATGTMFTSVTVYIFTTFQTKSDASVINEVHEKEYEKNLSRLEKKIDRLDDKVDSLSEWIRKN